MFLKNTEMGSKIGVWASLLLAMVMPFLYEKYYLTKWDILGDGYMLLTHRGAKMEDMLCRVFLLQISDFY